MGLFADSNRVSIRAIPESTLAWGVLPPNGSTRLIRITSSSLMNNKETKTSDELRFDRMVGSVIETSASAEGSVDIEYSAGSHDLLIQAFLLGKWSRPMDFDKFSGTVVSWATTSRLDISGADYTQYFVAGRRVVTGGFLAPASNSYFEIASVAFVSGVTQVTMTTSTATVEAGNAKSFIQDANDIVILKNSTIRSGTAGASAFDSNGGNAFTSAVATGQLTVGQKIQVDGFGYGTATIDLTATNPTDGEFVTVSDGVETVIFEFDNDSIVVSPRIAVTIGGSAAATAANLAAAINGQRVVGAISVSATVATTVVTVRNQLRVGGSVAESSANIAVTAFAGGTATSGYYTITAVSNDVISVTPNPGTSVAGVPVTIKASMVRNPSGVGTLPHQEIVPQSFTVETSFNDVGENLLQTGMRVGSFSLKVEAGEIVTGSFDFQGKSSSMNQVPTLSLAPYTPLNSTSTEVMNATTNVGVLVKDGISLATAIQSIELNGDASLRIQSAVGSKFPRGIGTGRFSLEGTITAYFENANLYRNFLAHDTVSLSFPFSDIDGNTVFYTIPALKFSKDDPAPGGIDEDIMEAIEFTAFRDPTTGTMLQLDRFSSSLSVTA